MEFRISTIFLLFLLSVYPSVFGQTEFEKGFKKGFSSGYCYSNDNANTCIPPLPPLAPLPQLNERADNYVHGYNRGFLYGIAEREKKDQVPYRASVPTASNSQRPQFNSYVPQNPILSMTPAERETYYSARAQQEQQTAEALGTALEEIVNKVDELLTETDQQKYERKAAEASREIDRIVRKSERKRQREAKKKQRRELREAKKVSEAKL